MLIWVRPIGEEILFILRYLANRLHLAGKAFLPSEWYNSFVNAYNDDSSTVEELKA